MKQGGGRGAKRVVEAAAEAVEVGFVGAYERPDIRAGDEVEGQVDFQREDARAAAEGDAERGDQDLRFPLPALRRGADEVSAAVLRLAAVAVQHGGGALLRAAVRAEFEWEWTARGRLRESRPPRARSASSPTRSESAMGRDGATRTEA